MVLDFFVCLCGCSITNWLIRKVVGVERYNDIVMQVSIVIWDVVWKLVSCCFP